jgi:hypothetical protein
MNEGKNVTTMSSKSLELFNIFRVVRNEIADENGYVLEYAIRIAFDRFMEREGKPSKQQSNCNKPAVINRRELLIDFCSSVECYQIHSNQKDVPVGVDDYLKSINSL